MWPAPGGVCQAGSGSGWSGLAGVRLCPVTLLVMGLHGWMAGWMNGWMAVGEPAGGPLAPDSVARSHLGLHDRMWVEPARQARPCSILRCRIRVWLGVPEWSQLAGGGLSARDPAGDGSALLDLGQANWPGVVLRRMADWSSCPDVSGAKWAGAACGHVEDGSAWPDVSGAI
jgi:hypothetical protein